MSEIVPEASTCKDRVRLFSPTVVQRGFNLTDVTPSYPELHGYF